MSALKIPTFSAVCILEVIGSKLVPTLFSFFPTHDDKKGSLEWTVVLTLQLFTTRNILRMPIGQEGGWNQEPSRESNAGLKEIN